MQIFNELNTNHGLSLALGFFDGIHLGHQAVVKSAVEFAKKHNTKSAVITFQDHPCCFFYDLTPQYIIKRGEKIKLLEKLGVDYLYFIKFDENISKLNGEEYLKEIIIKNFAPKSISTGFNHTFGADKSGNPHLLTEKQKEFGYQYFEVPSVKLDDKIISSTEIRNYMEQGKIEEANAMLGREYSIEETVVYGQQLGRSIGFCTANLKYPETLVSISRGVYSVNVEYKGKTYKGVANYGCKPSINEISTPILEVHILNFDEMIYYEKIKVTFLKKLRDEIKFDSVESLKEQIKKDIKQRGS